MLRRDTDTQKSIPKITRFALIGVGGIGASHLDALAALEAENKVRLVAVADPTLPQLASQKEKLEARGVRWHLDYRELLEREPDLDAVAIVTPIPLHREMTLKCLERGLFIYLEKPPVPLIQHLDELIAQDPGSRVGVGFQLISSPQVQTLKKLAATSRLGEITSIRASACWPRLDSYYQRARWAGKMTLDGEPVFDGPATNALAHLIHNIMFVAGRGENAFDKPVEVQAELYRARPVESYDIASLRGRFASGVTFTLTLTHATEQHCPYRMEVRGTNGWARISGDGSRLESSVNTEAFNWPFQTAILEGYRDFVEYAQGLRERPATRLCDTRGYVLATNGALVSSQVIHDVDPAHWRTYEKNGDHGYDVTGLADLVDAAFEQDCLLSELKAAWTQPTRPVNVQNLTFVDLGRMKSGGSKHPHAAEASAAIIGT